MSTDSLKHLQKATPQSKESEMMVLGCMLSYVNSLNIAADLLEDTDFYYPEHKIIFTILRELFKQDRPCDVHIVCEELKKMDKLKSVGGVAYITTLAQYAGTSAYIEEYANFVKDKAILRRMIEASQDVQQIAYSDPKDVRMALDESQQLFFKISQSANTHSGILLKSLLQGIHSKSKKPYLQELEEKQERYQQLGPHEPSITGIPSRFVDVDKMIHGLNHSNLMILAGRPAMGKTALALNIAENVCFKENIPVGIFSLEMSADQLMHRIICSQAEVESDKIKSGALDGTEYQRIVSSVNEMMHHTLLIDDQPGLKINDLRARARRMKEAHQIGLLLIDYLQLLSGSGSSRSQENRQMEISEISRMLKNLARELDIPIICLSQLSRRVEDRTGHRPLMSDLRESGSIEQDADVVMFLLRREYYDPMDKPGMAELIIAKNRHGAVGSVNLTYRKEIAQFANYALLPQDVHPSESTQSKKNHWDFSR